jgi:hypothetical protein
MSTERLRVAGAEHDLELFRRGLDGLVLATVHPHHPRQRLYQTLWNAQVGEARAVIDELSRAGVESLIIDGTEVGARYRPDHGIGVCPEVDLLVPVDGLWRAQKILYGRSYARREYAPEIQAWRDIAPIPAFRGEANGTVLTPFVKEIQLDDVDDVQLAEAIRLPAMFGVRGGSARAIVRVNIHHNVARGVDVVPFLQRSVASGLGAGRALFPADHLWMLILRSYFEVALKARASLGRLATVAPAVADPEVDWDAVVRNAASSHTAAPCLYWLTLFHKLGASAISERVLGELRSHSKRSEGRWGWQLGRMFEVEEPFPRDLLG